MINAWSDSGLEKAVEAFRQLLKENGTSGDFALPADVRVTGTAVASVNALPTYPGGSLRTVYDAGDNNQMLIIDGTTPDEYAAYCQTLASSGYTLYTEKAITDNRFATYINDQYVITAGYYAYETAARIIIEPRTTLPALEADNRYTKVVEPNFAMLGLEFALGTR